MKAIEVKKVTFSYSKEDVVLDNVSFDIDKGKYVSIVGHNGSGKSTLAKLLIGLLQPQSGEIFIQNDLLNKANMSKIRQKCAIVFQNPDNQFIGTTVEDDIAFGLENLLIPPEEMRVRVKEFAKLVGMEAYLKKEPQNLSGGQKQRVAIAGVLATNPDIVIFDESTSMLDPKGKREIRELINKMRIDNPNLTVVSITHDVEEAYNSDQVIVLSKGKVVLSDSPEVVFNNKETLKELNLTMPFLLELKNELKKEGIVLDKYDSIESLVDSLCQLK